MATPFGPNQAMNAFSTASTCVLPASAANTAIGRATSSVKAAIATRRPAVLEQAVEGEDRAEHEEHAELDHLDQVLASAPRSTRAMSGRMMPNAIAPTNTAMKPLPSGGSTAAP